MTHGGRLYELPTSEHRTVATGGSLLPTPTARDHKGSADPASRDRMMGSLDEAVERLLPTPRAARGASGTETMKKLGARRSDEGRPQGEVLLLTPTAQAAKHGADDRGPGTLDDHNLWSVAARIGETTALR
jgi:hypothetical protein